MNRIAPLERVAPAECKWVGICISPVNAEQRHLGIIYRDADNDNRLFHIHLQWHCRLTNEAEFPQGLWADPFIHERRLRQVAAMCRKVWRENGKSIPYAFSSPDGMFDPITGRILLAGTQYGLTCASFVLAVFLACGLRIVELDAWPVSRDDDAVWKKAIIRQLENFASKEHIRKVSEEEGTARFRPEEVTAAMVQSPHPRSFEQVRELSLEIIDSIL